VISRHGCAEPAPGLLLAAALFARTRLLRFGDRDAADRLLGWARPRGWGCANSTG
jgi:hypothetical protein